SGRWRAPLRAAEPCGVPPLPVGGCPVPGRVPPRCRPIQALIKTKEMDDMKITRNTDAKLDAARQRLAAAERQYTGEQGEANVAEWQKNVAAASGLYPAGEAADLAALIARGEATPAPHVVTAAVCGFVLNTPEVAERIRDAATARLTEQFGAVP